VAAVAIVATVAYKFLSSSLFGVGLEASSFGICCHVHPFVLLCIVILLKSLIGSELRFYLRKHCSLESKFPKF
jgi:membrane protein YqaA with SNARE-associated domain